MATTYEIRRVNLERLLEPRGAKTALAAKLGSTQANISHLLRKVGPAQRLIHEDTARAIETAIGIEPGSLDWPGGVRPAGAASALARNANNRTAAALGGEMDAALFRATTEAVLTAIQKHKVTPNNGKFASLVTLAYQRAVERGGVDAAYIDNLLTLTT